MEPRFFSTMTHSLYFPLWNKYRPAIIQLMVASEDGPQQYRLFDHEFKAINSKEKSYSFELNAHAGKALNNIKESRMAQDLLGVLNMSRKATELLTEFQFEFSMDRHFILRVSRKETI